MSRSVTDNRLQWATYGLFGLVALSAYSQASVQVFRRSDVLAHARETKKFDLSSTEFAKRGRILSADTRPLAQDEDSYVLEMRFDKVPHSEGFFADLAEATGIPASEFRELALGDQKSREWKTALSSEQSAKVKKVKSFWRADGLDVRRSGLRSYPLAEAAACVIGQLQGTNAVAGLEMSQNTALAGKNGVTVGMTDRTGAFLPMRLDKKSSVPKVDGVDVQTTIDFDLQQAASRAIKKAVETNRADQGVALAIDPKTGDILAMACWPTFDPTVEGGKGPGMTQVRDLNPATQATLEPGSTFKILTLAKAFDEGVVHPGEHFYCPGSATVGKKTFRCDAHHGNRAHGNITTTQAISKSCNVTAAAWARSIGYDDFISYIEQLGLLEKPGLGLPGEVKGQFNYNDPAKQLHLSIVGFGQAINVTPIALASAFSMLGNDGKLMFPRLITRMGTKTFPPEEATQVIKPQAAHEVMDAMEAVIMSDEGTGRDLRIPGYRLAGKTGTAERIGRSGGGYVSNFVGFVPAQQPKAMILVMVDHPTAGAYYGASVAGPVFVDMAKATIRRFGIPPTEGKVATQ